MQGGRELKYLGIFFMSKGKMEREFGRWIGGESAVKQTLYKTIVVKRQLSDKLIYVPSLTYGH